MIRFGVNIANRALGSPLFLNEVPDAAAAYSLQKLNNNYTGSAIRVRRSSDNTEQDIGFTASGALNTSALTSFVGSNNGFITKWYDQSGLSQDLSQTTGTNQPQIVSSGSVITRNSKPTILFDGTNDSLSTAGALSIDNGPITMIAVAYSTSTATFNYISGGADFATANGFQYALGLIPGKFLFEIKSAPSASDIQVNKSVNHFLLVGIVQGSTQYFYINGASNSKTIGLPYGPSSLPFTIGAPTPATGSFFNGEVSEVITYGSSKLSNISLINSNINSRYGIY